MITVRDLVYSYDSRKSITFPDFSVDTASSCLLLGESGSGKTTLLHLIGGLLRSQKGQIAVNGTDITSLPESQLDHFRGKNIGFIFQKNHLITSLSVKQNLLLAPYLAGVEQENEKVTSVLNELSLSDKIHADVRQLSQGQAQRVAIARAIINQPTVILADEPTSALDDKNCNKVIALLLAVAQRHKSTLLIATHDQRLKSKISRQIQL